MRKRSGIKLAGLLTAAGLLFPGSGLAVSPGPEIENALSGIVIGSPVAYRNLAIWPLLSREGGVGRDYLTLDYALENGLLRIEEKNGGSVPEVTTVNLSSRPVFIFAGEIIAGARQDRIVRRDTLLAPCGGRMSLAVYCVEQGRWHGRSNSFEASGYNAPARLRQLAQLGADQAEIWSGVRAKNTALGVAPTTGTLKAAYEGDKYREDFEDYARQFTRIPEMLPGTVGVAVTAGGEIVCVDIFGSSALFRAEWAKLLKSYIADGLAFPRAGRPADRAEIRAFLARIRCPAALEKEQGVSLGENVLLNWPGGVAAGLLNRGGLVHLSAFPREGAGPVPVRGRVGSVGTRSNLSR